MCPVPSHPAGGHNLHAGAGGWMGRPGEPLPATSCPTICNRCGLWFGYGILPIQHSREVVGDLGLPAGPTAHEAARETQQGLWWTLDGRVETLVLVELHM